MTNHTCSRPGEDTCSGGVRERALTLNSGQVVQRVPLCDKHFDEWPNGTGAFAGMGYDRRILWAKGASEYCADNLAYALTVGPE